MTSIPFINIRGPDDFGSPRVPPPSASDIDERFVAFAASGAGQLAEERPDIGHGLFTYALAKGLKGEALDKSERTVRVYGLSAYLSRVVRKMSEGRQTPEVQSGLGDAVLIRK